MNFISHIEKIPTESSSAQLQQQASRSQPTEITKTTYRYCQCTFSARCFHIFHYHTHTQTGSKASHDENQRTTVVHSNNTHNHPYTWCNYHPASPRTNPCSPITRPQKLTSLIHHISVTSSRLFAAAVRRHTAELQLSQAAYVIMIL